MSWISPCVPYLCVFRENYDCFVYGLSDANFPSMCDALSAHRIVAHRASSGSSQVVHKDLWLCTSTSVHKNLWTLVTSLDL